MKVLAIELGGTHASCAAVEDSRLLDFLSIETDSSRGLQELLPLLEMNLRTMMERRPGEYAGIGFGFCGLVDSNAGRVLATNGKYPDATSTDLQAWALDKLGLPLALENDTRLALLGEQYAGSAQGSSDVVMMTLGTGIGTAVISEGRLLRGKHFQAGCLGGHFTIAPGGRLCSCGANGCFEAEASTYALPDICRGWPGFHKSSLLQEKHLDFKTLFYWADRGDTVAQQVREQCMTVWSACALSLVHAYDPELMVLGGGTMKSSYPTLERLQTHVHSKAWTPWGQVRFVTAELSSHAALLGALPLVKEQHELHLR